MIRILPILQIIQVSSITWIGTLQMEDSSLKTTLKLEEFSKKKYYYLERYKSCFFNIPSVKNDPPKLHHSFQQIWTTFDSEPSDFIKRH